jgi:hypothetical protein
VPEGELHADKALCLNYVMPLLSDSARFLRSDLPIGSATFSFISAGVRFRSKTNKNIGRAKTIDLNDEVRQFVCRLGR